jgi:hypothetical protein
MICSEIGTSDQVSNATVQFSQDVTFLRASAEDALSRNFFILAVEPQSKQPLGKYSPNGVRSASSDPKVALRPYDDGIAANYGVACGKSNLAVIDIDKGVSSVEELKRWMEKNSLPETLTVVTGRDGFGAHLYYRGAVPSTDFALNGVSGDVKSNGGYVVGPGSVHQSGKRYEIINDVPLVPLPEVFKTQAKKAAKPIIASAVVPGGNLVLEGDRNPWQTSLVGHLRNFRNGELTEDAMYEGVTAMTRVFCEEGEAYVAENDAKIRKLTERGVRDFEVSSEYLSRRMSHAEMIAEAENDSHRVPIVKDLIFRKTVNIGIGDSGLGKTPFFLQLALCVAFGVPFIGQHCERGKVLIADYENYTGLSDMLTILAGNLGIQTPIDENWLAIVRHPQKSTLVREIEEFRPLLVIVDSLRGYDPGSETDNKSAAMTIANCQKVASDNDCAWAIIHHPRKQDKSVKERPDLFNVDVDVVEWLEEAAGPRALINQTYTRIGFAKPKKQQNAELGLRCSVKMRGELGPWLTAREYDDSGEPVGYKRLCGSDLLVEADRKLWMQLPNEPLTFGKALQVLFEGNISKKPALAKLLGRFIDAGVVKTGGKDRTPSKTYERIMEVA